MQNTWRQASRFLRKRFLVWKNDTPSGRQLAKLFARYRRRSKKFLIRALDLDAVMPGGRQHVRCDTQAVETVVQSVQPEGGPGTSSTRVLQCIRYFANPGPDFEKPSSMDSNELAKRVRAVAFYLPQFHAFEENDGWWGKGFSEWRNVARAAPRYAGHYQPRIPRDLGFYDLNSADVLREQSRMATRFGVDAFCFYYYWFNGKRLMDMPLDRFADDAEISQDFCIMWANENWTRTWDGFDNQVLIQQDYLDSDEAAFIDDTSKYMSHPRYLRVADRPLFILYRPGLIPNARATLARWRQRWTETLGVTPWVLMVQGFGDEDPLVYGLDGAVEFPPHKVAANVPDINAQVELFDEEFAGHIRSYEQIVAQALDEPAPAFPLIKTVSPHWDNDARREGRGLVLHGSTPAMYERWLNGAIDHSRQHPFAGESLVFINAWNEWAEAAYLEPDIHFGHAYLNATQRAVHGLSAVAGCHASSDSQDLINRLLLVGHDAHRHGAQMLLHALAEVFVQQFGMQLTIVLKEGGPMLETYREIADTHVITQMQEGELEQLIAASGARAAICNTCVTGDLLPSLKACGLTVVSLIHEMPMLIEEYALQDSVKLIDTLADHVIFPSSIVQRGFTTYAGRHKAEQHIRPQGSYKRIAFDDAARSRIRSELGLADSDKLVLNVGYADLRKGYDIFLHTAQQWMTRNENVHFAWVGAVSPEMKRWLQSDLRHEEFSRRIHLIGFTECMSDYYSASDAMMLTSREDPYPTVVLEAMNVGLPVVLFREATGFDAVMSEHGYLVTRGDTLALNHALSEALYNDSSQARQARIRHVEEHCQLDDYCFDLLQLLHPDLQRISVVVPNFNYETYMPERLSTIFAQDMPVFEVIVLDDCSSDNSVNMIEHCARVAKRKIKLVRNERNSGNVFRQWELGLSLCRGERVWIAEADDQAKPSFLSRSTSAFRQNTAFTFTNSAQIDESDRFLAASYDYYYGEVAKELFEHDFVLEGREFIREALAIQNVILNVSSVLWDRERLSAALRMLGDTLKDYTLVGDWRLYLACLDNDSACVSYISESLNVHRRHSASVTHSLDQQRHLDEILAMHTCARQLLDGEGTRLIDRVSSTQAAYEAQIRRQFALPDADTKAA